MNIKHCIVGSTFVKCIAYFLSSDAGGWDKIKQEVWCLFYKTSVHADFILNSVDLILHENWHANWLASKLTWKRSLEFANSRVCIQTFSCLWLKPFFFSRQVNILSVHSHMRMYGLPNHVCVRFIFVIYAVRLNVVCHWLGYCSTCCWHQVCNP